MTSVLTHYEALIIKEAQELNVTLNTREITQAVYLFAAIDSVRGSDFLSLLDSPRTAHYVIRFVVGLR